MKRYPLSAGIGITRSGSRSDWTSKPKLIVLVVCQLARSDFFFQDPNCENVQAIGRLSVPPTARTSQRPDWHSDTMDSGTQRINRTQCINASTFASVHVLLLRNLRFNWPKITLSCLPWQPKFYGNKQNHLPALPCSYSLWLCPFQSSISLATQQFWAMSLTFAGFWLSALEQTALWLWFD